MVTTYWTGEQWLWVWFAGCGGMRMTWEGQLSDRTGGGGALRTVSPLTVTGGTAGRGGGHDQAVHIDCNRNNMEGLKQVLCPYWLQQKLPIKGEGMFTTGVLTQYPTQSWVNIMTRVNKTSIQIDSINNFINSVCRYINICVCWWMFYQTFTSNNDIHVHIPYVSISHYLIHVTDISHVSF